MVGSQLVLRRCPKRSLLVMLPLVAALLTGCGGGAKNDTFDLNTAVSADGPAARNRQILVPEPTALSALGSDQVMVRVSTSEIQYLSKAQWSDKLPRMVQAKLVEAFEDTGKLGGVGKPGQGLAIDYQIVSDIRAFEINTAGRRANVEISVKILNDRNGTVIAQKIFSAASPVAGSAGNTAFIRALDAAFATVTAEIVDWTLRAI
ncbi:ABC transporter [Metarhizobium album]|uniref:ABC transporter n=1 Tax=Metarhizobium album TaxID=2182425 RepID=A0A2U2DTG7_9HYPH|nr:ABC-type transport auxiliary lipoprotein family protein [Rhizobium album]PWE56592.1 ABC transporter [Rhizobium album]